MLSVFFSSKCSLFHNANLFGSCIIHILYTGCAEIKKNNSGAKGLTYAGSKRVVLILFEWCSDNIWSFVPTLLGAVTFSEILRTVPVLFSAAPVSWYAE